MNCVRHAIVTAALLAAWSCPTFADGRWNSAGSGDWFEAENWLGQVPNSVGDTATFAELPSDSAAIAITSPVTVGVIDFSNENQVAFDGSAITPLQFDSNGDASQINLTQGLLQINVPVQILDERLDIEATSGLVDFTAPILGGDIRVTGEGRVRVGGDSSFWSGAFDVRGGKLELTSDVVPGNEVIAITDGGLVTLLSGDTDFGAPITLDNGTIFLHGTAPDTRTLDSDVVLGSSGGTIMTSRNTAFAGRVSGSGSLFLRPTGTMLLNSTQLEHTGDIRVEGVVEVEADNSFAGQLFVDPGGHLFVDSSGGLGVGDGTVETGTVVGQGGRLTVRRPVTGELVQLQGGAFVSTRLDTAYGGNIELGADNSFIDQGRFGGEIFGDGGLTLRRSVADRRATISLESANSYTGETIITESATVRVQHENALGSLNDTIIRNGRLFLEVAANENFIVNGGELIFDSPASYDYARPIKLAGGTVRAEDGQRELKAPIVLDGTGELHRQPGVWSGGSSGIGHLQLTGNGLIIEGMPLTHSGRTSITGDTTFETPNELTSSIGIFEDAEVNVNHIDAFGSAPVVVTDASLHLNGDFSNDIDVVGDSNVVFNGDYSGRVRLSRGGEFRSNGAITGEVHVVDRGLIRSTVDGTITGPGRITFFLRRPAADFAGERQFVHRCCRRVWNVKREPSIRIGIDGWRNGSFRPRQPKLDDGRTYHIDWRKHGFDQVAANTIACDCE